MPQVKFLQTADSVRYRPMLEATSRTAIEYCRAHGHTYESYIGIKRGFWPWQATYNRIHQLQEILDRGFRGWAVYLDADAYVVDQSFDIRAYLRQHEENAGIMTPSMATDQHWDINAGVVLINLGHPLGREIVQIWSAKFAAMSDERLREAQHWLDSDSDQDMIQSMLRERADIAEAVFLQSTDLINSSFATFIRQHLRSYTPDFQRRLDLIKTEVDMLMGIGDEMTDGTAAMSDARAVLKEHIVEALYKSILRREADNEGRANSIACLEHRGIRDGVTHLLETFLASEEYERLKA